MAPTKAKLPWPLNNAWVKAALFGSVALAYVFAGADLIPDAVPGFVGYLDDALVVFIAAIGLRNAIKTIEDNMKKFL